MRQVLDFFELLTPEDDAGFVWNLKLATTNSPLTVEGEPYHPKPEVDARAVAAAQRSYVEDSFRSLSRGQRPVKAISAKRKEVFRRILNRNMNGIGSTEAILVHDDEPVYVTPRIAEVSVRALAESETADFDSLFLRDRARSEYGTIEGVMLEVGSDYHSPSVLIKERRTGQEVWCRVRPEVREKISLETTLNDVWGQSRVAVRGRIRYATDGSFVRVWAHELRLVKPKKVSVDRIIDEEFTGQLSVSEYLEQLRGADLG